MEKQRLDKIIASTGKWSRKDVKLLVKQGRVLVDGVPAVSADDKYDPEMTPIEVDGEDIGYCSVTWLMMNKPAGYLSATEDGKGETVLDLLPRELQRRNLFPVGRLDKDTEGLLLLTNDGELAHRLLAPKSHVDKVYYAEIDGTVDESDARAFSEGMILEDDGLVCQSAQLRSLGEGRCEVTLREGKYHQVKRMLAQRGKPVRYLKRLAMGGVILDKSLEIGQFRPLSETELARLEGSF
jgi:16S rRNA pseudouridine516 synthase